MDKIDQRARREQDDRLDRPPPLNPNILYPPAPVGTRPAGAVRSDGTPSGYTLMVAGQRTGKTAFLRLLLDTSDIAPSTSQDKLASVAKFVQGCAGPTSHIRTVSIDVELDLADNSQRVPISLTLVDTPTLDVNDEVAAERVMGDILRHVDAKFAESIEDEYKARTGDHHVHLCIYFLDPDDVVPPSAPTPPVPLVPRPRTGSISLPDPEPVILEPPVTTNPLLCRPTLPLAEINVIRTLSSRVNVLPIIARADTLTNERLAAIKMAIRRDLAEAGIGFGIFDIDNQPPYAHVKDDMTSPMANGDSNVYGLPNGSASSSSSSSPTSPMTPSFLRLPYALISPDIYSHSDGVNRMSLSRHELVLQYTPSNHPSSFHNPSSKIVRGKFTRAYRWGSLDVLDHNHSDFLPLRQAVFHHMQTLQKYTREYLFDKFRVEFIMQQRPNSRDSIASHLLQNSGPSQLQIVSSRPVHTIDAPPSHGKMSRHPSVSVSRQMPLGDGHAPPAPPALSDSGQENAKVSSSKSNRQRAKKITVACNFCRSRKLKCDGGRPACHQCLKRSNPCDYMAPQKRRGGIRQRRHYGNSDSENGSGDDPSLDMDPSESPEVMSKPLNRVNSGPEQQIPHHESMQHQFSQREDAPVLPPLNSQGPRSEPILPTALDRRAPPMLDGHDRPNLPSLSFPSPPGIGASAPPMLPPMRSTEEGSQPPTPTSAPTAPQGGQTQRKRASTVSGKGNRSSSNYGPKVVACNYCRARKTKCDGAHPTCSSCARRSLACNYVNDPNMPGPRRKTSNAHSEPASASSNGQSSSHAGPSSSASMYSGDGYLHAYDEESGQEREYADDEPPSKRIRIEGSAATSPVAVLGMP